MGDQFHSGPSEVLYALPDVETPFELFLRR
jgi:hypothetical protein